MTSLPKFSNFNATQFEPGFMALLQTNRAQIDKLTQQHAPTWDSLIRPLEEMENTLHQQWSTLSHLHNVADDETIREVYGRCLAELSDYHSEIGQHEGLYRAIKYIADHELTHLTAARAKVISDNLRDFHLSGIDLPSAEKQQYRELQKALAEVCNRFEENLLDATHHWFKHITDVTLLAGIPEHAIQSARQEAEKRQLDGWVLTLEFPCYSAVVTYGDKRELRQEIYTAFVTRASELGEDKWDNSALMNEILAKRHAIAQLLNFNNYAELSLATKMLKRTQDVLQFLSDLAHKAAGLAKQEMLTLTEFAKQQGHTEQLQPWDIAYYSEKLLKHTFHFNSEDLRPYFPEPQVMQGMFDLVGQLYGLTFKPVSDADTWHAEVKCYAIYDTHQHVRGYFYTDLYARSNKRGGAWMDDYCSHYRKQSGELQLPIAFLSCNFTPPQPNQPALFTHDEVLTLFHEFGHGLHHLLTQVEELDISGINGVEWDAVELPSQFMENFCWDQAVINRISSHYQTHEPLPTALFANVLASKNFQAGMQLMRQLEFALFDFRIHAEYATEQPEFIASILNQVRQQVAVVPIAPFNRFQHSFSHIFAGGYAAGYYSYKWAEVLACDAFAKFAEHGVINPQIGREFLHCILEQGGSAPAMELFKAFRGREPQVEALLQSIGLGLAS